MAAMAYDFAIVVAMMLPLMICFSLVLRRCRYYYALFTPSGYMLIYDIIYMFIYSAADFATTTIFFYATFIISARRPAMPLRAAPRAIMRARDCRCGAAVVLRVAA